MRTLLTLLVLANPLWAAPPPTIEPAEGRRIVFSPEKWEAAQVEPRFEAWTGRHLSLLTLPGKVTPAMAEHYLRQLDLGWETYADLTGRKPATFKQYAGMPTVTAVPSPSFTCGAGCGFVGSSGVELALFYDRDTRDWVRNPQAFPHYGFYELGRNFYTFGRRHDAFTTGFAVFMRYVCMDRSGAVDLELAQRHHIERMIDVYATSPEPFVRTFTAYDGLSEKQPRLRDAQGKALPTCDQPVMYASAMLRLRRDLGGDDWVRRFFAALAQCPETKAVDRGTARRQCLAWYACASAAAGRDLADRFITGWRLDLTPEERARFASAPWGRPELDLTALLK